MASEEPLVVKVGAIGVAKEVVDTLYQLGCTCVTIHQQVPYNVKVYANPPTGGKMFIGVLFAPISGPWSFTSYSEAVYNCLTVDAVVECVLAILFSKFPKSEWGYYAS